MEEILKTIAELPPETIETFMAISNFGFLIYMIMFMLMSLAEAIYETTLEKRWRRKALKFLSNEDIELISNYLDTIYSENAIGKIVVNAYKKEEDLKKFRKQRWQKVKDFFKFKK